MKQQLGNKIVLNLLILSVLGQLSLRAEATETQINSNSPATTITEWLSQLDNYPASVTNIEVRSTIDGVDVILTTADGEQLQGITSTEGNNLIIDIPNARLDLPEEELIRENPANGIASVTVTTVDVANIQVTIAGTTGTPIGEAITTSQGITISAIPTVAEAGTPNQVIDIIVTAQYDFNPNLMVYGSIARGYNPAGVNYEATVEEVLRYDTETSTNYEIGLKSSWFRDRLNLNLAAFYSPVENFQLLVTDNTGFSRQIANADADIAGVEVELRATPFE